MTDSSNNNYFEYKTTEELCDLASALHDILAERGLSNKEAIFVTSLLKSSFETCATAGLIADMLGGD